MTNNCVFCDKSKFEERLVGETKDFWIIATLGQISNSGYELLVPKRHVECIGAMKKKEVEILEKLLTKAREALTKEYGVQGIIFEHGIVGQTIKHAHLHLIPEICSITGKIYRDFPDNDLIWFPPTELSKLFLKTYAARKEPYLFWQDSISDTYKVVWNPPAPPQYLRTVVAEALGRTPEIILAVERFRARRRRIDEPAVAVPATEDREPVLRKRKNRLRRLAERTAGRWWVSRWHAAGG